MDSLPDFSETATNKPKSQDLCYQPEVKFLDDLNASIDSNFQELPKYFSPTVTSTAVKPILKSSKTHTRCSSLGQSIRYLDETSKGRPSLTLFNTSQIKPLNLSSSASYDFNYFTCPKCGFFKSNLICVQNGYENFNYFTQDKSNLNYSLCDCHIKSSSQTLHPISPEKLSLFDQNDHFDHHNNENLFTNDNVDRQSVYSVYMEKDFRYFFQHPYARLFIAYFVIFCNFLIFAEDPISHSHTECKIPIVGNVISFICTKYPSDWFWITIKVSLWLSAIIAGLIFGKYFVHRIVLRRILRLKMFRNEEGTWMIMFILVFISCYAFSILYNFFLFSFHPNPKKFLINTRMGISNASFMKAAACGTWLGDFFTALMVTDMMLQDELYPNWAVSLRSFWLRHDFFRIVLFWTGSFGISAFVIYLIVSDDINWDNLNQNYANTSELTRALLASMILVMDLLIVMQDWDFPHFVCDLDIKLPGLKQASYTLSVFNLKKSVNFPETFVFHITGKWFNYGIIMIVMLLDLNMWKNQIFYFPPDYGQYTGPDDRVYTLSDMNILATGNTTLWSYDVRAYTIDPKTNHTLAEDDLKINSRYLGYSYYIKSLAFLPCAAGFILFFTLIYQYGRFPPKTDATHGGRLKKRKANLSWKRERRDSRHGYISWRSLNAQTVKNTKQAKYQEANSNV